MEGPVVDFWLYQLLELNFGLVVEVLHVPEQQFGHIRVQNYRKGVLVEQTRSFPCQSLEDIELFIGTVPVVDLIYPTQAQGTLKSIILVQILRFYVVVVAKSLHKYQLHLVQLLSCHFQLNKTTTTRRNRVSFAIYVRKVRNRRGTVHLTDLFVGTNEILCRLAVCAVLSCDYVTIRRGQVENGVESVAAGTDLAVINFVVVDRLGGPRTGYCVFVKRDLVLSEEGA